MGQKMKELTNKQLEKKFDKVLKLCEKVIKELKLAKEKKEIRSDKSMPLKVKFIMKNEKRVCKSKG